MSRESYVLLILGDVLILLWNVLITCAIDFFHQCHLSHDTGVDWVLSEAVFSVDWRKCERVFVSKCDNCVFIMRLNVRKVPLRCCKRHSWSRSVKRGPEEEEEFGVFPFYPCLPLLLIASSLPSVSVCQSGGTAGVGQSVNAVDSPRRLLGDQRRKAPGGSLSRGVCQTGTKRRESWAVEEWAGACWTGRCCSSRRRSSARGGQCTFCQGNAWDLSMRVNENTGCHQFTQWWQCFKQCKCGINVRVLSITGARLQKLHGISA